MNDSSFLEIAESSLPPPQGGSSIAFSHGQPLKFLTQCDTQITLRETLGGACGVGVGVVRG